jgi:hypothetical protein
MHRCVDQSALSNTVSSYEAEDTARRVLHADSQNLFVIRRFLCDYESGTEDDDSNWSGRPSMWNDQRIQNVKQLEALIILKSILLHKMNDVP